MGEYAAIHLPHYLFVLFDYILKLFALFLLCMPAVTFLANINIALLLGVFIMPRNFLLIYAPLGVLNAPRYMQI